MAKTHPVTRKPVRVWLIEASDGLFVQMPDNAICAYQRRKDADGEFRTGDRGILRATLTFDAPTRTGGKR